MSRQKHEVEDDLEFEETDSDNETLYGEVSPYLPENECEIVELGNADSTTGLDEDSNGSSPWMLCEKLEYDDSLDDMDSDEAEFENNPPRAEVQGVAACYLVRDPVMAVGDADSTVPDEDINRSSRWISNEIIEISDDDSLGDRDSDDEFEYNPPGAEIQDVAAYELDDTDSDEEFENNPPGAEIQGVAAYDLLMNRGRVMAVGEADSTVPGEDINRSIIWISNEIIEISDDDSVGDTDSDQDEFDANPPGAEVQGIDELDDTDSDDEIEYNPLLAEIQGIAAYELVDGDVQMYSSDSDDVISISSCSDVDSDESVMGRYEDGYMD